MNTRIKELRKAIGLTQQEFADRLNMNRGAIANYEIGRNEPINAVISLICKEFNVNEEWLRTGKGGPSNMFNKATKDDEFNRVAKMICQDHDNNAMNALIEYWKLDPDSKKALWNFVHKLSNHVPDNNIQTATTPDPRPDIALDSRDANALSAAVREAEESYIKSRSSSVKKRGSSASSSTSGENGDVVNQ